MAPVVYVGPYSAAAVAGSVFRRNTPADVDEGLAGRLLARPDFLTPDEFDEARYFVAAAGLDPEAEGDGDGAALPSLPDSAHPPDATPLDPLDPADDPQQEE